MEEVLSTLYKVFKCKSYCSILNKRMTKSLAVFFLTEAALFRYNWPVKDKGNITIQLNIFRAYKTNPF